MQRLLSLLVLVFCAFTSNGQEKFSLTGKVQGFSDGTWLMLSDVEQETVVDSTQIFKNAFAFQGQVVGPERYIVSTKFTGDPESYQYKFMWIEPGEIYLEGKKGDFRNAVVKGSKIQVQENALNTLTRPFEKQLDSLNNEYRKGSFSDSTKLARARMLRDEIERLRKDVTIGFVGDHPDYLYSAYILTFEMHTLGKEQTRKLYELLDPEIQASKFGVTVKNYIDLHKEFQVGDRYTDIRLPNHQGKVIKLSSLAGKYILLDFWASNCGPCRMEHPELRKLYNTYKDKGFEIFAVSIDKNKQAWVNAMEKDQITWPNVSDLQGNDGETALTYGVYYIPTNYLINPEGVIIAKDIRGKALEEKVKSLFDK